MQKTSLDKLDALLTALGNTEKIYLPVDTENGAAYQAWQEGDSLSLACNTVRSAKDFFFPQTENMMDFKTDGKKIEIIDTRTEAEDFVVFGVRACDARSFDILDSVFLADPVDTYYKNRREHGTIVTLACTEPEETCFCRSFGIDATNPTGDVSSWICGNEMFFRANTDKGERLLQKLSPFLSEGDDIAVEKQQDNTRAILKMLPLQSIPTASFKADKLMEIFHNPNWASLSHACLGCGTCTFVCPTCQCFDIRDFDTGHGVRRFRCWDSCMYSDFTQMAAANPRLTQLERFRQRFMHKLVYYPANHGGVFGCVGCGRCLSKCPISMNIVKVMKEIGGDENDK